MKILFSYTNAVPDPFKATLQTAADIIDSHILDPETLILAITYGPTGSASTLAYASPQWSPQTLTYAQLVPHLGPGASKADPSHGGQFLVSNGQARAWGLTPGAGIDGSATFSSDVQWDYDPSNGISAGTFDALALTIHELTHALGRAMYSGGFYTALNLFTYSGGIPDPVVTDQRYFSMDQGQTDVANFDPVADPADFALGNPPDPFNSFFSPGQASDAWTTMDTSVVRSLGFQTPGASVRGYVNITPASLGLTGPHFLSGAGSSGASGGTHFVQDHYGSAAYENNVTLHPGDTLQVWGVHPSDLTTGPAGFTLASTLSPTVVVSGAAQPYFQAGPNDYALFRGLA